MTNTSPDIVLKYLFKKDNYNALSELEIDLLGTFLRTFIPKINPAIHNQLCEHYNYNITNLVKHNYFNKEPQEPLTNIESQIIYNVVFGFKAMVRKVF